MTHSRICLFLFAFSCFGLSSINASDFPKAAFTITTSDGSVWVLDFKNDGKFDVTQNGEEAVQGKYKVSKTQIEFVDESGLLAEPNAKEGTYQWKYEDDKLTFDKMNDAAEGRSATLTAGPWDKRKNDLVLSNEYRVLSNSELSTRNSELLWRLQQEF